MIAVASDIGSMDKQKNLVVCAHAPNTPRRTSPRRAERSDGNFTSNDPDLCSVSSNGGTTTSEIAPRINRSTAVLMRSTLLP